MKHCLSFLLVWAGLSFAPYFSNAQGSLVDLDAKNGFRDAVFGSLFSSFKGMSSVDPPNEKSDWRHFERKSDTKMLGDIPLDYITYLFYKGYLYQVGMQTKGHFNEIFDTITQAYGKHTETHTLPDEKDYIWYYWKGAKAKVIITKGPEYINLVFQTSTPDTDFDKADAEVRMQKRLKGL